jgi:hypothetical protein
MGKDRLDILDFLASGLACDEIDFVGNLRQLRRANGEITSPFPSTHSPAGRVLSVHLRVTAKIRYHSSVDLNSRVCDVVIRDRE